MSSTVKIIRFAFYFSKINYFADFSDALNTRLLIYVFVVFWRVWLIFKVSMSVIYGALEPVEKCVCLHYFGSFVNKTKNHLKYRIFQILLKSKSKICSRFDTRGFDVYNIYIHFLHLCGCIFKPPFSRSYTREEQKNKIKLKNNVN